MGLKRMRAATIRTVCCEMYALHYMTSQNPLYTNFDLLDVKHVLFHLVGLIFPITPPAGATGALPFSRETKREPKVSPPPSETRCVDVGVPRICLAALLAIMGVADNSQLFITGAAKTVNRCFLARECRSDRKA